MHKFILAFAFSLYSVFTLAQDQWLVTTKLDTVRGQIYLDHGGQYKVDEARIKIGKTKSVQKAHQIRFVFLGEDDTYEVLKIDGRYQFAKVDVKGKYFAQYLYIDPSSGNSSNYSLKLLVNWKGDQHKIGSLTPKKRFAEFFEDCELVSDKILSGEYKRKNLDKIFDAFDQCIDDTRSTRSVANNKIIVPSSNMEAFISDLKEKNLYSTDLSMMITDISQKLNDEQPIPQYLQQAVLQQLGEAEDLKSQFLKLIQ